MSHFKKEEDFEKKKKKSKLDWSNTKIMSSGITGAYLTAYIQQGKKTGSVLN